MNRSQGISLLWCGLILATLSGCSGTLQLFLPEPGGPVFSETVDSVVLSPIQPAGDVRINTADLAMLDKLLREELDSRPALRTYDTAPTLLPNTVLLGGELVRYQVNESPGDGLYLRSIELGVTILLTAFEPGAPEVALKFQHVFQRVYGSSEQVAALPFDLRNAMRELAVQIVQKLNPQDSGEPPPLEVAEEEYLSDDESHPLLIEANSYAEDGRYERAASLWALVLFNPEQPDEERLFHLSSRSLGVLARNGAPTEIIAQLDPLRAREPLDILSFRAIVREVLGAASPYEGPILNESVYAMDRMHRNLAATHSNMALWYQRQLRVDLAAYHLAMAAAYHPKPGTLSRWRELQNSRNLIPNGVTAGEALRLYQQAPTPAGVAVAHGSIDRSVLPPSTVQGQQRAQEAERGQDSPIVPIKLPPPDQSSRRTDSPPPNSQRAAVSPSRGA